MHITDQHHNRITKVLQWICFFIFVSRAYQYIFWDAPFRTLLWDEGLLKGVVEFLTPFTWNEYVTNPSADGFIQNMIILNGVFFLLCAVVSLMIHRLKKSWGYVILFGAFSLSFLSFLYTKEKFFHVGQFFEYSIQFASPVLLYLWVNESIKLDKIAFIAKVAVAVTFVCHGLYAVGYYPRPGNFVDMVINSTGVSEGVAHNLLFIAAVLDFVVAILLFIPNMARPALYYMVVWGFMTSAARLTSNIYADFFWPSMHQWWFEFVVRLPHALLPLMLVMFLNANKSREPQWSELAQL